jgi:hypothetical protein
MLSDTDAEKRDADAEEGEIGEEGDAAAVEVAEGCWGFWNRMEPPNIYENKLKNTFMKELKNSETRDLQKSVFPFQSHEPLYMCPHAPFSREM